MNWTLIGHLRKAFNHQGEEIFLHYGDLFFYYGCFLSFLLPNNLNPARLRKQSIFTIQRIIVDQFKYQSSHLLRTSNNPCQSAANVFDSRLNRRSLTDLLPLIERMTKVNFLFYNPNVFSSKQSG